MESPLINADAYNKGVLLLATVPMSSEEQLELIEAMILIISRDLKPNISKEAREEVEQDVRSRLIKRFVQPS